MLPQRLLRCQQAYNVIYSLHPIKGAWILKILEATPGGNRINDCRVGLFKSSKLYVLIQLFIMI